VIFTLGILWRRANAVAAVVTIISGFIFTWALAEFQVLGRFNTYNHRALCAWIFCMLVMIITSLLTAPPPREKTDGIIWSRRYALLPPDLQRRYSGIRDFRLWWGLYVLIMAALYGAFLYNRLKHPINMINGWPSASSVEAPGAAR
jgi:SSS family solute:Na+ symporter